MRFPYLNVAYAPVFSQFPGKKPETQCGAQYVSAVRRHQSRPQAEGRLEAWPDIRENKSQGLAARSK
jgi:hypothetical protein